MAARIFPVDAVSGTPSNTGRVLRQTSVAPFVALGSTSRLLGALSGVRPGTSSAIGSVTSTQWTVNPFAGVLDGESLAIAGPYTYAFDTAQTGSVNAATSSACTDRLDVQVSDPAESDGSSTPGVAIVYTAGTSTAVPAAPPRSHPLFLINRPATGGGAPTLTWAAPYTVAPGGIVPFSTLGGLQLWTTAAPGQHATVLGDGTPANDGDYVFTGSAWVATSLTIGGSVKRSGAPATFTASTWSPLTNTAYWTTDQPVSNMNAFNGAFVAPIAGVYDVSVGIQLDSTASAILCLKKNDSSASSTGNAGSLVLAGFANYTAGTIARSVRLNAGDYVAAAIYVTASAIWNTGAPDSSFFSIRWREPLR